MIKNGEMENLILQYANLIAGLVSFEKRDGLKAKAMIWTLSDILESCEGQEGQEAISTLGSWEKSLKRIIKLINKN